MNQGGEMVRAVSAQVDASVPMKTVHATRGKWLRAEPVAAMYPQGRVKHAAHRSPELEDQMCDFGLERACRPAARPTGSTRWCGR